MNWVEDEDGERIITLRENGIPADLTDATIDLVLRSSRIKTRVVVTAGIRVLDPPTSGKIGYTPNPSQLTVKGSPYSARWRVKYAQGTKLFPYPAAASWVVHQ
jgi:hypothetical protein